MEFARRERQRALVGAAILLAWGAGLGALVRREYYHGSTQRLAEAAMRLSPGATYYAVQERDRQIGFASTTIDTTSTGIEVVDYLIADLPLPGAGTTRSSARSVVQLSRTLALRTFDVEADLGGTALRVGGRAEGDSAIVYAISTEGEKADSQRIAVRGPILLPTLVPLVVALGAEPRVGRRYTLPSFDPTTMSTGELRLAIRAESLFTVVDSAKFDRDSGEWVSALTDTVRAWRVEPVEGQSGFTGWIDAQGRIVQTTQAPGLTLKRMAYEIAFDNWRIALDRATAEHTGRGKNDILERTAIAAGAPFGRVNLAALTVLLAAVDLRGFDLAGGRQALHGDTLRVGRERDAELRPSWSRLNPQPDFRQRFRAELSPEPLLQSRDPDIVRRAVQIAGDDRDPRVMAEKINQWVHDSLRKEMTLSVPNAVQVLRTRKGDCNEHTQLYVALARASGIPARIATGLAYVNGKFYYHAWPEVWLRDWVAVDPTFGQFPADAAHLRFVVGGLAKQTKLLRLIGNVKINVLEAR